MPALLDVVRERLAAPRSTRSPARRRSRWPSRARASTRSAHELGVSERQLRRRFAEAVGYGPKTLARVLRFQRFLDAARETATTSRGWR